MITDDLRRHLLDFARARQVLIASDYDGTLAEIVDDPAQAWPVAASIAALRELSLAGDTVVAVISGRSLVDLRRLSGLGPPVHLVGSHGTEFANDVWSSIETPGSPPLEEYRRQALADLAASIATAIPGVAIEFKPRGVALHYRRVEPALQHAVTDRVERWVATVGWSDTPTLRLGKLVVEIQAAAGDKGTALSTLRDALDIDAVLFIGDDLTDEDAFAALQARDIGIKVGPGESRAAYRLDDVHEVSTLLDHTAALRSTSR